MDIEDAEVYPAEIRLRAVTLAVEAIFARMGEVDQRAVLADLEIQIASGRKSVDKIPAAARAEWKRAQRSLNLAYGILRCGMK